jgi:hypothetical protein
MNDDATITALRGSLTAARDSLTDVHLGTPVDTIVRRGRAHRQRRALGGLTAVTAVAGGIVVAAATLGSGAGPATAKLDAWTVTKQTDGIVKVTIQDVRDAGGLQETLRADGIPVTVNFPGHDFEPSTAGPPLPASCQAVTMSDAQNAHLQERILPMPKLGGLKPTDAVILIKPAAIPPGIGLSIEAWAAPAGTLNALTASVDTNLVQASPACTG